MSLAMTKLLSMLFAVTSISAETISGVTVNSMDGQPVGGVDLLLMPNTSLRNGAVGTRSDTNVHFMFQGVSREEYRLKVRRRGFLDTEYGANGLDERGKPIAVQNSETLRVELAPAALITGTIRDLDGEPVEGAYVVVIKVAEGVEELDSTTTTTKAVSAFQELDPENIQPPQIQRASGEHPISRPASCNGLKLRLKLIFPA